MRVPISWLKDFVDIPLPISELAERLTFAGLEVEDIQYIGVPAPAARGGKSTGLAWDRERIFVAQLVEARPHPNADRLQIVRVDYGRGAPVEMVTGAPNIGPADAGRKVALALEGSKLYDGHKEGRQLMTLKKSKIRGVESSAMVCSEKELGLSEEHEGIILLPDDAPVGTPLADYLGDAVLDIKINPNFARAQSVLGVAREVAALTEQRVRLPERWDTTETGAPETEFVKIEIADPRLCARFSALLIRNVTPGPSPYRVQRRLELAGMRPINKIVDVTNYVMLGYGKPLHAFDYDRLVARARGEKPTIVVRPAKSGETMETLDGQLRCFGAHDLLVTDSAGPVGIAGIMGGSETEVSDATRNVLLESAIFDFISIRRTTAEQKLPSEAATRFGRGIPPSQNVAPARLAAELLVQWGGGEAERALADNYPAPQVEPAIRVTTGDVRRILGIELAPAVMTRLLESLDFEIKAEGADALRVTPPDYRTDVDGTDDVLEELVRLHGYDRIPSTLIADALPPLEGNLALEHEEAARDLLVEAGLQEIVTYVFTNPAHEARLAVTADAEHAFPLPARPPVTIANPISEERSTLRQTLLPNMLDTLALNLRHTPRVALFEIGRVFLARNGDEPAPDELPEDREFALPGEPRRLGIVMTGPRAAATWQGADTTPLDLFDLKGVVQELLEGLHVGEVEFRATQHPSFHPGRAALLVADGTSLGVFGELHPSVRERWGVEQPVLAGEFELEPILARRSERFLVKPLSRYPAVVQDIALLVDEAVSAGQVEGLIRQTGGALLAGARLFDVYRGAPLPDGKKSLAYTLSFQSLDHVLSDQDAAKLRDKIVSRLRRELGAELRSG